MNETIKKIKELMAQAEISAKEEITKVAAKYLDKNPDMKTIVFGGYTPEWCDGDVCEFLFSHATATNLDASDVKNFEDIAEYVDEDEMNVPMALDAIVETRPKEVDTLIRELHSVGLIERIFDSSGFIAKIYKNEEGQYVLVEEEYDCGY